MHYVPRVRLVVVCDSMRGGAMNAPNSVQIEPEETIQVIFSNFHGEGHALHKGQGQKASRDSGC